MLPVDLLFDDEQIGDFVKSIQIDSPYQQMLLEGVLTESVKDEKLYVSFTVEGYFHFVLGEFLFKINSETVFVPIKNLLTFSTTAVALDVLPVIVLPIKFNVSPSNSNDLNILFLVNLPSDTLNICSLG